MLARVAIKRPVTTVMVLLMVFLAGIVSYTGLDLALMPTIDIPVALVSTTYVGASPDEMETLITKPLEEAVSSISNVDKVTSISSTNSSMVVVQFVDGVDIDMAALDIREKVDLIKGYLPEDSNDPLVMKIDMNAQPVYVGVTSETLDLAQLNDLLDENVVSRFERIEGISAVNLSGGDEKEIQITLNTERMQGYGLLPAQISQVLSAENMNLPSGKVMQGTSKMQIRTIGEFKDIDEIRELPITTPSGAVIHLSDVAEVEEVAKEKSNITMINGKTGILISLDKQSTANLVEVSDKINAELEKVRKDYPEVEFSLLSDTADYIKDSIHNVITTAFQSAIIAVLVLFMFLRSPITALIIGISIPTSILATFGLMYMTGMTMNIISMGGVTIGIGMLVDNSVVVLDNIYKYWERGYSPKESAELGANEIAMAVAASTFTTIAVFLPLTFIKGTIGQMLQNLSYTICFSLIASLIVSLTFVPMACSLLLFKSEKKAIRKDNDFNKVLDKWGNAFDKLDEFYRKVLVWSLKHRKRTVAYILLFFILTLAASPIAGFDFMPEMDQGVASISVKMPKGTELSYTEETTQKVLERLDGMEEIDVVYAKVGAGTFSGGADSASVTVNLVDKKDRKRGVQEVCKDIRERVSDIAGADITVTASEQAMGSYGGKDVTFHITGYDMETLRQVETEVKALVEKIDGLTEVSGSSDETVPEAKVSINRAKASQYGISTYSLANLLSTAVTGSVATQYKVDGDEIDVRIRYDQDNLNYINDVKNIMVPSSYGGFVPLTEVADVDIVEGSIQITRENQKKYVSIEANTDGIDSQTAQKRIDAALAKYSFPEGYGYNYTGTMEQMISAFKKLMLALIIAVLLIYMIMASQFESLIYPGIIMFATPVALTGGILGLILTGNSITVTAFMGFIMLVGVVVNNAIVLVDYTNQLMARGKECDEALILAGPNRLRPILMTTLTTIIGLMPLAIGNSEGMEMQRPMAIVVIFGLTISTVVTLIFIPVIYSGVNDLKRKFRKRFPKDEEEFTREIPIKE